MKLSGKACCTLLTVWILNVWVIVCGIFFLMDWTAFVWIVGDIKWSVFMQVLSVLCLMCLIFEGWAVLGSRRTVKLAYEGLKYLPGRVLCVIYGALTLSIILVFLYTAVAALSHSENGSAYTRKHAHTVFTRADNDNDGYVSFQELSKYTFKLSEHKRELYGGTSPPMDTDSPNQNGVPSGFIYGANTTETRQKIAEVFDFLDSNLDGFLTEDDVYRGLSTIIRPSRERLGIASLLLICASLAYPPIFYSWYSSYWQRELQEKARSKNSLLKRPF